MNLPPDIAIIDLLRQREAEFVLIWQCEQKIKQLLNNEDFPMDMPVTLPSQQKTRRQRRQTVTAAATAAATPGRTCRKLQPEQENAYRIVYRKLGVEESSFQTDQKLIIALLELQGQDFQVLKLQTVRFLDLDNWQIIDTLID